MNQQLYSILSSIHQESIINSLNQNQQSVLLQDLLQFNLVYPGGIYEYIKRAISFLKPDSSISSYTSITVII